MPGSSSIRGARLSDAAQIAELSGQLGYPASTAEITDRLSRLLVDPDYFVAVAEDADASLLGWIGAEFSLLLEIGEEIEIVGLVVRQGMRRIGIGQALLSAAEEWARQRGQPSIRVRSNAARLESHPFYKRMDYERVKTQHCYRKSVAAAKKTA